MFVIVQKLVEVSVWIFHRLVHNMTSNYDSIHTFLQYKQNNLVAERHIEDLNYIICIVKEALLYSQSSLAELKRVCKHRDNSQDRSQCPRTPRLWEHVRSPEVLRSRPAMAIKGKNKQYKRKPNLP